MTASAPSGDPLRLRTDEETLREVVEDRAAVQALADDLEGASDVASLGRRTVALRLLGRLDEAEACGRRAVGAAGDDRRSVAAARARLGHVLHWQERYAEAEQELAVALSDAEQLGDERLKALALQHRGMSRYDQGRTPAAERDFSAALQIRRRLGEPDDEIRSSEQAVTAAMRRIVGSSRKAARG